MSARWLAWVGERCETRTNAIPVSRGRAWSSWVKASSPPADAPTQTTGNGRVCPGASSMRASASTGCSGVDAGAAPFFLRLLAPFFFGPFVRLAMSTPPPAARVGNSRSSRGTPQGGEAWLGPKKFTEQRTRAPIQVDLESCSCIGSLRFHQDETPEPQDAADYRSRRNSHASGCSRSRHSWRRMSAAIAPNVMPLPP